MHLENTLFCRSDVLGLGPWCQVQPEEESNLYEIAKELHWARINGDGRKMADVGGKLLAGAIFSLDQYFELVDELIRRNRDTSEFQTCFPDGARARAPLMNGMVAQTICEEFSNQPDGGNCTNGSTDHFVWI